MPKENKPSPIKTAICSFGMSGRLFHAPFIYTHPGFQLYGALERTKKLAEELYPDIKTFRSLDALLNDEQIELVIVNTPNLTHFDFAKQALLAGKHVVVEKPFTITSAEANQLIEIADNAQLKLTVYQNRRYDSDFKTIRKILNEGTLGKPVEVEFRFDRYKEEIGPKKHKETPAPGTGSLYDLGAHLIDQALVLFGIPDRIFADIGRVRAKTQVDDYFELLLFYPEFRVRLKSNYLAREPVPEYVLHYTLGSFIKKRTDRQEELLDQGHMPDEENWAVESPENYGLLHVKSGEKMIKERIASGGGNYLEFYEQLYRAIRWDEPVPVPPSEARQVIRVIEAAYKSHRQGCIIEF